MRILFTIVVIEINTPFVILLVVFQGGGCQIFLFQTIGIILPILEAFLLTYHLNPYHIHLYRIFNTFL